MRAKKASSLLFAQGSLIPRAACPPSPRVGATVQACCLLEAHGAPATPAPEILPKRQVCLYLKASPLPLPVFPSLPFVSV